MVKKILAGLAFGALAIASAATGYNVTFYEPITVNGAKLKAGSYKVEVNGSTAVIRQGKTVAESPVKVETEGEKFSTNSVRLTGPEGSRVLSEIRFGGTRTRLVFEKTGDATN